MWPECFRLGVAAITYDPLHRTNLSKYPRDEPQKLWAKLAPAQKFALRQVAYEMKKGDVIYVKQGPSIVGKGIVQGSYDFDSEFRIVDPNDYPWPHQVPVSWIPDFPRTRILLGGEQSAVKRLEPKHLKMLEAAIVKSERQMRADEAQEGELYTTEAAFRSRNRALIEAKKANSDYKCEVCDFQFEHFYGGIGQGYIVAHHLKPIASGPTKTKLDDIALVCPNCHAMLHMEDPPLTLANLRGRIKR